MPSTISYKRGDVVLVPFPFTDFSSSKQRPALVVSADGLNATRDDVLVAAITSQVPAVLAVDWPSGDHRGMATCKSGL